MSESNVDPTRLLADKVAIVTGGARGVGRAVAEVFVEAGASVAVVDVDEVELGAACRSLEKGRGNALPLAIDVSTIGAGEEIARECVERFGRLDVLVNNAAVQGPAGSVVEAGEADWERYFAVNLRGPSRLLRAVLPVMCDQGGGRVVNIASVSSYLALPRQAAYATSKAAILQLTRSVAIDFGRYGVRSNCVCPGPILSGPLLSRAESNNGEDDPVIESLVARHATGRLATPKDIAYAVLYLAGPYASQVTGAVLVVDGGFSIA
jgi:NAD(P)-dependent dehydrogenase (short-subunit alcohol dehydrogenase family)